MGRDPIMGLMGAFRLSDLLLSCLRDHRIYFLAQAGIYLADHSFTGWKGARDLHLTGTLAAEWEDYTYKLRNTGLRLQQNKDSLYWSRNVKTGNITAALAYKTTVSAIFTECIPLWFKEVWRWRIPLKTVIFSWLLLAERIHTWKMLQRKGFEGPSICSFCHNEEDSITHLMIECPFTLQVWHNIGLLFETDTIWNGLHITHAFEHWIRDNRRLRSIPFHVCRFIWLARNSNIFHDITTSPHQIVFQVQLSWREENKQISQQKTRNILQPNFRHDISIGFFDGASQEGGNRCGVGLY